MRSIGRAEPAGNAPRPDRTPWIGAGRHQGPEASICLMELASMRAGESFTDHPRCVHPTLASLTRLVNDSLTGDPRQGLVALLPQLMAGPRRDPRVAPVVVLACLSYLDQLGTTNGLARHRRRAERRLVPATGARLTPWATARLRLYQRTDGERALTAIHRRALGRGDHVMAGLLQVGLKAYQGVGRCSLESGAELVLERAVEVPAYVLP